jgi:transcription factor STE12
MLTCNPIRHRRTHEPRQDGEPIPNFSEEELDGDDDNLGSLEEESPESNHGYLDQALNIPSTLADMPSAMNGMGTTMAPQQLVAAQNF